MQSWAGNGFPHSKDEFINNVGFSRGTVAKGEELVTTTFSDVGEDRTYEYVILL